MADENEQGHQLPGEAGLVEVWDEIKGEWVTMQDVAEREAARKARLAMKAAVHARDAENNRRIMAEVEATKVAEGKPA